MSTTLNFYWNLASPAKEERLDASVKLVSALQSFQTSHVVDMPGRDVNEESTMSLDDLNAQDVSYALRRLVRGLASARESSRLGFAVALTEVRKTTHHGFIILFIIAFVTYRYNFIGPNDRSRAVLV